MVVVKRKHRLTIARVSFVVLVVLIPVAFGVGWVEHKANDRFRGALRASGIVQCERGNRVRAWIRWDVRLNAGAPVLRTVTADRLFPILDCEATQDGLVNVPLPVEEQIAYIVATVGSLRSPEEG